jgi:LPXTG-site transpeptidase (sortase) family protein
MKFYVKRFAIGLGIIVLIFLILDFAYFRENIRYIFNKPAAEEGTKTPDVLEKLSEPNILTVPSLGIAAPVIYVAENSETVFQQALKKGIVHFPGTANPGEYGNCYIFGHSSDFLWSDGKYKTVFALLPRIEKGAQINVSDSSGHEYAYTVVETKVVATTDVQYLSQGEKTKRVLTLQTSYPVGTALKRFIVIAEMK